MRRSGVHQTCVTVISNRQSASLCVECRGNVKKIESGHSRVTSLEYVAVSGRQQYLTYDDLRPGGLKLEMLEPVCNHEAEHGALGRRFELTCAYWDPFQNALGVFRASN